MFFGCYRKCFIFSFNMSSRVVVVSEQKMEPLDRKMALEREESLCKYFIRWPFPTSMLLLYTHRYTSLPRKHTEKGRECPFFLFLYFPFSSWPYMHVVMLCTCTVHNIVCYAASSLSLSFYTTTDRQGGIGMMEEGEKGRPFQTNGYYSSVPCLPDKTF